MITVIEQELPLPADMIYQGFWDLPMFCRWFKLEGYTTETVNNSFEEGGSYVVKLKNPKGHLAMIQGTYLELKKDRFISYSWKWIEDEISFVINQISVNIEPLDDQNSTITVSHSELMDERLVRFQKSMWQSNLKNLVTEGQLILDKKKHG